MKIVKKKDDSNSYNKLGKGPVCNDWISGRIVYTKLDNIPTRSGHRSHPFTEIEESKV
jgi:hypothetical protein